MIFSHIVMPMFACMHVTVRMTRTDYRIIILISFTEMGCFACCSEYMLWSCHLHYHR